MRYELLGRAHGALVRNRGQGTVEYVGLILLMAVVLAALVAAAHSFSGDDSIPSAIVKKLKGAIDGVGAGGAGGGG